MKSAFLLVAPVFGIEFTSPYTSGHETTTYKIKFSIDGVDADPEVEFELFSGDLPLTAANWATLCVGPIVDSHQLLDDIPVDLTYIGN